MASRTARHLAFISSLMGRRDESIELARESIRLLEMRRPLWVWLIDWPLIMMPHQRMSAHANLGCVLHYSGALDEAEKQFERAEEFQAASTRYPWLRAIWGYRYADLLLDLGRFDKVEARLEAALVAPDEPRGWGEGVFAAPLLKLGFVRLRIRQADHLGELVDWSRVLSFAKSFENFGEAERRGELPEAAPASTRQLRRSILQLRELARPKQQARPNYQLRLDVLIPSFRTGLAGVARLSGDLDLAERQVNFAESSARAAGISLFSNEIVIERARILLARGRPAEAFELLQRAGEQSSQTSYRRQELERLAHGLSSTPGIKRA
jgi:tetratricopeptide (TPR) repeat protein